MRLPAIALAFAMGLAALPSHAAWEPTRPIELIVPAGAGGGADIMARTIQGIISKHNLMKQPLVVINKAGGAGGEGFLDMKLASNNPHKLVIALSNLFTTPMATKIPFNWKDLTPVAMLALDEFVLWVNADAPYKSAKEFIDAAKRANGGLKMGGTGSRQEDQVITEAIQHATGARFTYIPYRGGGEVAVQLVGGHVDATVSNPNEAIAHWRSGKLRPLCVFDTSPIPVTDRIAGGMSWSDIPTCRSQGLDVSYLMLRGLFTTLGATSDQVQYYADIMRRVRATPEWQALMKDGAFNPAFVVGAAFSNWLAHAEWHHFEIMQRAGFTDEASRPATRPLGSPPALAPAVAAAPPVQPQPAAPPVASQPRPPQVAAVPPHQQAAPQPAAPAQPRGRRVALVIGNSAYAAVPRLANSGRDATTVAAALRSTGFDNVTVATDLTREKLVSALIAFAREADKAEWGVVYYAGHGVEIGGINYLIPVDARLASDRDIDLEGIPLNQVLGAVERASALRLVMLDACRDNPFVGQMRRMLATRSVGRGLARVEPEAGTLVVYAAKHGETALDGDGENSPFVTALVKNLTVPGVEIRRLFDNVRDDVLELTRRRQQPFSYGSLPGRQDYYFVSR